MAEVESIRALEGVTTVERLAFETLRGLILDGTLAPGQRLKQEEVAARLGVSKTPVQQAFKQLDIAGYVTSEPHRSVIVAPLSAEEIEELYVMRVGLERLAARLATPLLTEDALLVLRKLRTEEEAATAAGLDVGIVLELDREFHLSLYRLAGRQSLIQRITSLREQCERYMRFNLALPGQVKESMHGHAAILDACAARDPERVTHLVVEHIEQVAVRLIRAVRERTESADA